MIIEEWLQAQKQAGNVSLPLYVDDNGNQCMQTHAYATRYGNSNVEKELNKLRTLDMNDRGIIKVPEGTNPLDLVNSGLYWTKVWADGSIPLPSSYCVIQVIACDDNIVFLKAYYPTSQTVFTNSSYLDVHEKRWFGWKLITGEVELWRGNIPAGTSKLRITGNKEYSAYGHLLFRGTSKIFEVPVPKDKLNDENITLGAMTSAGNTYLYLYNDKSTIYIVSTASEILQIIGRP